MDVRKLIAKWENAETSRSEEMALREYFRDVESVPDDLWVYAVIFRGCLGASHSPFSGEMPSGRRHRPVFVYAVSACFACLVFCAGMYFGREPYCYVDGRPVRDAHKAVSALLPLKCLESLTDGGDVLNMLEGFDVSGQQ